MILALLVDLILPSSKMKQYVKLVIGLLLILIILQPLLSVFKVDVEQFFQQLFDSTSRTMTEENIENEMNEKKSEIESVSRAYVLEEMVVQMENLVKEELLEDYEMEVEKLEVYWEDQETTDVEGIERIYVQLTEANKNDRTVTPVHIQIGEPEPKTNEHEEEKQEIVHFLAEKWQVDQDVIVMEWKEEEGV